MKGKLFLVGLLSFSVLGLGGFYFFGLKNNQFNPRGTYSEFFIGEANSNQQFVPMKDYSTSTKPRRRGQRGRSNNNSWGVASPNFNRSSVNVHRYSSMNESKSVSANYFQHSGEEYVKNTGGLGGSNLLIAGRSSSSTSGDGGGASFGGIAFGTGYGRPQSAPPMYNGNTILVDPGLDPEQQIPVGNGVWILSILALAYGVRIKLRK